MSHTLEVMRMGEQIAELEEKVKDLVCEVGAKEEVILKAEGRLSLAKALLTQWLHGGESNINIVSDTQRFLEGEHERQ